MNLFERQVSQAALDVAIERLTTQHPAQQAFVFGPQGEPFWARFEPTQQEVEQLSRALSLLEGCGDRPAPLTVREPSGQLIAMVLDEERSLYAVLLASQSSRPRAEARVASAPVRDVLRRWHE